jgi:hypothetical protein
MGNPPISTDDYHFSFSLAIMGDSHVGKSTLVGCTLPEEAEEAPAESGVDHGVLCKAHTYESRGARYQYARRGLNLGAIASRPRARPH